jgi:hypothetical protein
MADAAQRQRKLAAKAARRKAAVAEKKKKEGMSTSLAGRIQMAAKGPIVHCLMPTNLFEAGIGNVLVARRLPSGMLGCAWFLVDVFCLGVKDIFYREVSEAELRSRLEALSETQEFVEVEPTRARRLIRDAAAYAAGLGLPAAKDTPVIEAIFGDFNANACTDTFTFGKDGKPFYVSGPYDTPARIRTIGQTLEKSCGTGNWDYMVEVPGGRISVGQ